MRLKLFKIRVSDEFIAVDQKSLDKFLAQHNVLKYESAFVKDHDPYWSVILYYEEMNLQVNEV